MKWQSRMNKAVALHCKQKVVAEVQEYTYLRETQQFHPQKTLLLGLKVGIK